MGTTGWMSKYGRSHMCYLNWVVFCFVFWSLRERLSSYTVLELCKFIVYKIQADCILMYNLFVTLSIQHILFICSENSYIRQKSFYSHWILPHLDHSDFHITSCKREKTYTEYYWTTLMISGSIVAAKNVFLNHAKKGGMRQFFLSYSFYNLIKFIF